MNEMLEITFTPTARPGSTLEGLYDHWRMKGYIVESKWGGPDMRLLVPLGDESWRAEISQGVNDGVIAADWDAGFIECLYSSDDIQSAPVFSVIHTGRDIAFPQGGDDIAGVCHICDVDTSRACPKYGAGAVQDGSLRIPAAELNKAGKFASIWIGQNIFLFVADTLAEALSSSCKDALPFRQVEPIGKSKLEQPYWQLCPDTPVSPDALTVHRAERTQCPECGEPRLTSFSRPPGGRQYSVLREEFEASTCPPVPLCPFWEGDLARFADGRVQRFPERRPWLRGDLARELMKHKIRGLTLEPILFGTA